MSKLFDLPNAKPVWTGFPSPADDHENLKLNLNDYLVKNRQATFFFRVSGDSMVGAGIHDGDLLIVDKSVPALSKKIIVGVIQGELLVKRLLRRDNRVYLVAENPNYDPIEITPDLDFSIWGVVTNVIHEL